MNFFAKKHKIFSFQFTYFDVDVITDVTIFQFGVKLTKEQHTHTAKLYYKSLSAAKVVRTTNKFRMS